MKETQKRKAATNANLSSFGDSNPQSLIPAARRCPAAECRGSARSKSRSSACPCNKCTHKLQPWRRNHNCTPTNRTHKLHKSRPRVHSWVQSWVQLWLRHHGCNLWVHLWVQFVGTICGRNCGCRLLNAWRVLPLPPWTRVSQENLQHKWWACSSACAFIRGFCISFAATLRAP